MSEESRVILLALAYSIAVSSRSRLVSARDWIIDRRLIAARRLVSSGIPSRHAIHAALACVGGGDRVDVILPWLLGPSLELSLQVPRGVTTFAEEASPAFGRRIDDLFTSAADTSDMDAMILIAAAATVAEAGASVMAAVASTLCARACLQLKEGGDGDQKLTLILLQALTHIVALVSGSGAAGSCPAAALLSRRSPLAVACDAAAIVRALIPLPGRDGRPHHLDCLASLLRARLEGGAAVNAPLLPAAGEALVAAVLEAIMMGKWQD